MHYNLTNKKQRKQFWKDCEKAVSKCSGFTEENLELYNWEKWKKLTAYEVLNFWDENPIWDHPDFDENLSKNAYDTFSYYDTEEGIPDLDDADSDY